MRRVSILQPVICVCLLMLLAAVMCAAQTAPSSPQLITGRYGMPAVVIGDSIAVIGGSGPDGFLNDIERINFTTGAVTDISTHLTHRRYHTAQVQGHYLYVLGGVADRDDSDHLCPLVERYDLRTGQIALMAPLPTPRRFAASALYEGRIYVVGGDAPSAAHAVGTLEIYDIASNTWREGAPMPTPRETALALMGRTLYAVGGYDGHEALRTFEAYDIASDTWQALPDLPQPLSAHHIAVDGDFLFTFGDYTDLNRVTAYHVTTGNWRTLSGTGYQSSRHNAVVTARGFVYVLGGNIASSGSHLTSIQNSPLQSLPLHALEAAALRP